MRNFLIDFVKIIQKKYFFHFCTVIITPFSLKNGTVKTKKFEEKNLHLTVKRHN
jgi:hypothetical protein